MERLALIIFKLLYDERARSLLQATAKPRAKAYRVKPGQNHGSPRLASGHGYLRRYCRNIRQFHLGERESRSTFAAQFSWWVMKIGARRERETPKGENVENSPIKSRVCPTYIYSFYFSLFHFLSASFSLARRTLSLYDLVALELCLFVPFSLLFSCYPVCCRLRQKSKSFFNSPGYPG